MCSTFYRRYPDLGGVVHTHSTHATAWAQAGLAIPALGTTHADYFFGDIPCTRALSAQEVDEAYELNSGQVIIETLGEANPLHTPGIVVYQHGPFAWGKDAHEAVHNAVVMEEVANAPYFGDRRLMISIFMSLWNVHANWFPVDGKVKFVKHVDGNYHKAWLPKASEENEHADVMITTPEGVDVLCRQIAGAVARRIVTYAKEGEECFIDEHLGFIKLGSRVDVYLPVGTEVCVKMGQSTTGDQTIIAKLK